MMSIPAIIWFASAARWKPDVLCSECVPAFPGVEALNRFLPEFAAASVVFGPDDFGLPSSRDRRYSTTTNNDTVKPVVSLARFCDVATRSVELTGRDFLRASPGDIKAFIDRLAIARGIPPRVDGKRYRCLDVMTGSDRLRLAACIEAAAQAGGELPVFWDVRQSKRRPRMSHSARHIYQFRTLGTSFIYQWIYLTFHLFIELFISFFF